ncbi:MAG: metallophosphoesterase [Pseudonocardiaceae bacterium]
MKLPKLRQHVNDLGFEPQDQIRWLSPRELVRTVVKVLLAGVFANYSDKREIQAALGSTLLRAPREPGTATELWIDYVADLGDGFDATATIAHSIAAEKITVTDADLEYQLNRGDVLVLGGDEVYPAASAQAYEDRFKGPYRAALPESGDDPLLVALPGNHDWYDGLTSFLRLFTQRQPIGAWQTEQTRSYFAIQLPQRWWLVGLDSQLGNYIDEPQLEYFRQHLSANLKPGDGVIVCSAKPTWVDAAGEDVNAFNSLHFFDRNVIRTRTNPETRQRAETGASIRVWLTGDQHHYARYAERLPGEQVEPGTPLPPDKRRRQMVTCGLGGAYLSSTHQLPGDLSLPPAGARMRGKDDSPLTVTRAQTTYPDASTSRSLARRLAYPWSAYWMGRRNPGFPKLAAGVHAVLFLMLSVLFGFAEGTRQPIEAVRSAGLDALGVFIGFGLAGIAVFLLFGLIGRRARKAGAAPSGMTTVVLMQVAVALTILAVTVAIPWPAGWAGWVVLVSCLVIAGGLGTGLGTEVFAISTLLARSGEVAGWQMAGQAVEDRKGFLRLHIGPDGDLTIYPLVIDEICHEWKLVDDPGGGKRPVPASPPSPRLAESPLVVAREVSTP